jgi:hypothetical protein
MDTAAATIAPSKQQQVSHSNNITQHEQLHKLPQLLQLQQQHKQCSSSRPQLMQFQQQAQVPLLVLLPLLLLVPLLVLLLLLLAVLPLLLRPLLCSEHPATSAT